MDTPELWWGSIKTKPCCLSELALRLFGIIPSQANCERNFSTLRWIIGDRRTRLAVQKLENITKIRSYYLTNIKSELVYHGKELKDSDLQNIANNSSIGAVMNLELEDRLEFDNNDNDSNINSNLVNNVNNRLDIENIIDFEIFRDENEIVYQNNTDVYYDVNFDPETLLDSFLEENN
jgi:hypothetical protein